MTRSHSLSAFSTRIGIALFLTAASDFLLFRQPANISLFVFAALVAAAMIGLHSRAPIPGPLAAKMMLAAVALLPLAENVSPLSVAASTLGLSVLALSMSGRLRSGPMNVLRRVVAFLFAVPFALLRDISRLRAPARRGKTLHFGRLAIWTIPIVLGAVFVILFGIANPVIGYWMSLLDLWAFLELLDIWRLTFWVVVVALVWAFLRPRLPSWFFPRRAAAPAAVVAPETAAKTATALEQALFGKAAILRALVVFNVLFAVQTVLDGAYLWGGVQLPAGLTYAGYAHRGAYALIVTALLAAIFVLVALRPGSETSADRRVRTLVYLWSAQNVVLVVSSILRLDLYVGIYSLTYWRVAAFIWMGLVATGIVLIMARIALENSNEWLLGANLLTLSTVLYASCFINFAAIIGHYNVTHSSEMSGGGLNLDWLYLNSLGPAGIPATDLFLDQSGEQATDVGTILWARNTEAARFIDSQQNWRAWSFRNWRLAPHVGSSPRTFDPAIAAPAP